MSTIVTRSAKGSSLTWAEADANFTNLNTDKLEASSVHNATEKATPVDADEFLLLDSVASFGLKKTTWSDTKITLKSYFDTQYQVKGTYLVPADIGVTVQGYDVNTVKKNIANNFGVAVQTTNELTDNDGSFDLSASLDFKCTPTAGFALTFTNIPSSPIVQKGTVVLVNGSNYVITAGTNTKLESGTLTKISATGTYELFYRTSNGVVYVTASGAMT